MSTTLGAGVEVTVMGLLDTIRSAAGLEPRVWPLNFVSVREGEVRRSCLDVTRARRERILGATTVLSKGIEQTMNWVRVARKRGTVSPFVV